MVYVPTWMFVFLMVKYGFHAGKYIPVTWMLWDRQLALGLRGCGCWVFLKDPKKKTCQKEIRKKIKQNKDI